jgi:F-type H+-transporting ATPase subunit a
LSIILISIFFIAASRKASVVPGKLQFVGESIYAFVRKDLAEEIIGHGFLQFVPFLFTLFTFVLVNNIFGIIPFLQFPAMSHVAFPYVLAGFSYFIFHAIGIKKQGLGKYLKGIAFLPGVPKFAYILLTPIEIATYFLIRPVTLSLRLFANMFAGHLLLLVFHRRRRLHAPRQSPHHEDPLAILIWLRYRDDLLRVYGAVPPGLHHHPAISPLHCRRSGGRALTNFPYPL